MVFETLTVRQEGAVLFAKIAAPANEPSRARMVRDLVSLIQRTDGDDSVHVLVFQERRPRLLHLARRRDPDSRVPARDGKVER
jgi:hypothetical protein